MPRSRKNKAKSEEPVVIDLIEEDLNKGLLTGRCDKNSFGINSLITRVKI